MCLAMAAFTVEDALLKFTAARLPVGQVLMTFGVFGVLAFSVWAVAAGEPPLSRAMLGRAMILRPGTGGFGPLSLLAVLGMLGSAGRDLATRAAPPALSFRQLGVLGFVMLIIAGLLALPFGPAPVRPDAAAWLGLAAASLAGIGAYTSLTIAMRTGEVGAVTPFRYTRLFFAMIAGIMVFGERPDLWTAIGSTLIILAGITALRLSRRAKAAA